MRLLPFWYPVLLINSVLKNPIKIDIFSEPLVVYKSKQNYIIHSDICPHQGASFSSGWINKEGNIQCPYHGFEFCDGQFCKIPNPVDKNLKSFKNGYKMKTFPTIISDNILFIKNKSNNNIPQIYFPPEEYNTSFVSVDGFYRFPSHYIPVIENLLDMLHISYVHSFGSSKTPLPNKQTFEYINEHHGRSTFEYIPNPNSMGRKVGNVEKVKVQNEFILPTNTVTRVYAGSTIKTVFTRCIPISNNETILYWKMYRNFWVHPLGDFISKILMEKTLKEDLDILKKCYPRNEISIKNKIHPKYDKTIMEFRKTLLKFLNY